MTDFLTALLQLAMSFLGSLGFALLYNVKGLKLLAAGFGGVVAWLTVLLLQPVCPTEIARLFIAAMVVLFYDEIFAFVLKTPTTTYLVPSIVPLTPGAHLYYCMSSALQGDQSGFIHEASQTIILALAIAGGIIIAGAVVNIEKAIVAKIKKKA